jgi:hypothetical protein
MKKIVFLLIFASTISTGIAQSSDKLGNMINDCLNDCLSDYSNAYLNNLLRTNVSLFVLDYYPHFFQFSDSVINNLKNKQFKPIYINNPNNYKYLKEEYPALFFDGLSLDSNRLIIHFSKRFVRYDKKKKIMNIAISDWFKHIYEYSCEEKRWIFIEKVSGGI